MNSPPLHILIVGASGFIGRHLVQYLLGSGHKVAAWSRTPVRVLDRLSANLVHHKVDLLAAEPLPDPGARPWDVVFQLAGESRPSQFVDEQLLRETVGIAERVVEHVAKNSPGCRYIFNSSAYVYAGGEEPCKETDLVAPSGLYGRAKLGAEEVTLLQKQCLHVTIVRPFNLIGAGMPEGLFATRLLRQLRMGKGPVQIAGADILRDLLDIGDALEAYDRLIGADYLSGRVFNLCSGTGTAISEFARALLQCLGQDRELHFQGEPGPPMLGSNASLCDLTGWRPFRGVIESARGLVSPTVG
jgi:nucleoside-diphosphate-sugar epimerase